MQLENVFLGMASKFVFPSRFSSVLSFGPFGLRSCADSPIPAPHAKVIPHSHYLNKHQEK